jgi:hypothetical protein
LPILKNGRKGEVLVYCGFSAIWGSAQIVYLRYFEIWRIEDVVFGIWLFMTQQTNKEQYLEV